MKPLLLFLVDAIDPNGERQELVVTAHDHDEAISLFRDWLNEYCGDEDLPENERFGDWDKARSIMLPRLGAAPMFHEWSEDRLEKPL